MLNTLHNKHILENEMFFQGLIVLISVLISSAFANSDWTWVHLESSNEKLILGTIDGHW